MALTERTEQTIVVAPNGSMRIRDEFIIDRDGVEISRTFHSKVIDVEDDNNIVIAHCGGGVGCVMSRIQFNHNINKRKIWVVRYQGKNQRTNILYRNMAADLAYRWVEENKLQYVGVCKIIKTMLPCFKREADRQTARRYIEAAITHQIPRYPNTGKPVLMFCSKFGLAVWMGVLGIFGWRLLDKCLPLKPSNCLPGAILKLHNKFPKCWKFVGEFTGWKFN